MSDESSLTAALQQFGWTCGPEFLKRYHTDPWVFNLANAIEKLTAEVAALRVRATEALAAWMIEQSFATGHGDSVEDLLKELTWQVEEIRTRTTVMHQHMQSMKRQRDALHVRATEAEAARDEIAEAAAYMLDDRTFYRRYDGFTQLISIGRLDALAAVLAEYDAVAAEVTE